MRRRALFLDRDGTLVEPRHYPRRPEELVLAAGVGPALRALGDAGFALVVITNQGGLAHGYFSEAELDLMHAHLARELAAWGVGLAGVYHCPHHPEGSVSHLAVRCDCRKPEPGMVLRAAADLDLDLDPARSWFVGDILDDVEAGRRAGCRTVLVDLGTEAWSEADARRPEFVARDTAHALAIIAAVEDVGPTVDLRYRPARWGANEPVLVGAGKEGQG